MCSLARKIMPLKFWTGEHGYKEFSVFKEKSSTFHRDNRKHLKRISEIDQTPSPPSRLKGGCESCHSFEKLSLGRKHLRGILLVSPRLFHCAQPPRHSEANVGIVQDGSAIA
jgi:hypothetical protein